ncbi:hypothetical protein [Marispirochaeta sp.]|jgi:hypothetical protein|uniref:hypothetical protein n=1 Tax=Marispirochaeta sp. TaxID=2038653 RepID=UPI0029C85594|nr:hypothetical protein [Marispirochaeta sp.]
MHKRHLLLGGLIFLSWACCTPFIDLNETGEVFGLTGADLAPPILTAAAARDEYSFTLGFNEDIWEIRLEGVVPPLGDPRIEVNSGRVIIQTDEPQLPGAEYVLDVLVKDRAGNSQQLLVRCYGYNPRVPGMLINEFTTRGSSTHPDVVELLVLEDGNLAGACLYEGTSENWEQRMVFPDCEVLSGEFLLVHFKPQGIPEELNETAAVNLSGGLDAHPEARDFWVDQGSGLSGNNGVIALYRDPFGAIMDAVLYSNRTSASDERYRGFGSAKVMERADTLADLSAWTGESLPLCPEDAVNPDYSTATRSLCRSVDSIDTGSKGDWHTVPTGGYSFGAVNSDELYVP